MHDDLGYRKRRRALTRRPSGQSYRISLISNKVCFQGSKPAESCSVRPDITLKT